jgi:hypothetical protein
MQTGTVLRPPGSLQNLEERQPCLGNLVLWKVAKNRTVVDTAQTNQCFSSSHEFLTNE